MSSSESSTPDRTPQPRMVVPNLYIPDPSADETDLANEPWMVATVIDDDDLMFGGKPLSAWYEEDRRILSCSTIDEEETRGRQRERTRADSHHQKSPHHQQQQHQHQHHQHHHHQHHHHQHHHHHHHHSKNSAEIKE